jgi:fermentation-respiration switch protein FrsA (DUF1100 family)
VRDIERYLNVQAAYGTSLSPSGRLAFLMNTTGTSQVWARAPLFIIHGANDPRVPLGEAEQMVKAASQHVPTELLVYDEGAHGLSKRENRIGAYSEMVAFLNQHV